jgi:hypothetical protein
MAGASRSCTVSRLAGNGQVAAIAAKFGFTLAAQWALAFQQHKSGEYSQAQGYTKEIFHCSGLNSLR